MKMIDRKNALVIYHSPCLDGFTAAWVAKKAMGNTAEYIPGSYTDDITLPDVDDRVVYLLDFAYPKDVMIELARRASTVIVLDHHLSAQKDLEPLLDNGTIEGEFDMERSGAMIAWNFFFLDQEPPEFIKYVQDRDLWTYLLPRSRETNIAMFSYEYSFDNWDRISVMPIEDLQHEGDAIWRKHIKDVRELTDQVQYMTICGIENIPTVNANYFYGSDIGDLLCQDKPFAAYYWINKKGKYIFGLRSCAEFKDAMDVSEIAKVYGGGGHANAAGFLLNDLNEL